MPILRRDSFYSGPPYRVAPTIIHPPPSLSLIVSDRSQSVNEPLNFSLITFTQRGRGSLLDEKPGLYRLLLSTGSERVYCSVAENSQAISDVYLVRVVLDTSGRRIWFGKIAEKLLGPLGKYSSTLRGREGRGNGTLATPVKRDILIVKRKVTRVILRLGSCRDTSATWLSTKLRF